ncbi:hypothetical protein ACCO45_000620 [Purpureocillium lilacinum]|uniref:Uncharacterized protein n=1 Tax=Purpureocillium lilacinum TaxID=33203 RepID=A0ACC4E4Q2_PURLI
MAPPSNDVPLQDVLSRTISSDRRESSALKAAGNANISHSSAFQLQGRIADAASDRLSWVRKQSDCFLRGETRFSDEIINPNMITVYPAGVNKNWQGPTYATPGVSDKVFTTDLVNRIKNNYCVDEARVYGTGHSKYSHPPSRVQSRSPMLTVGQWSRFSWDPRLFPEHGGQFAAFAPISGAFYTDVSGDENCHPSRSPIPMFEVHGTADPTISYDGGQGRGGPLPSIPDWLSRWARRNRCSTSNTEDIANGAHDTKWTCANIPGLLEHIKIDGHDHSWPGPNNSPVDVSPLVIKFLSNNYKP